MIEARGGVFSGKTRETVGRGSWTPVVDGGSNTGARDVRPYDETAGSAIPTNLLPLTEPQPGARCAYELVRPS